ncbi:uncharacterized protein LOC129716549 [Wyeomyia smithii]|uniref:uncharacterized protein LOC129716549 n=1 Tax=Wyeomyia smithii TaxID=174621 RepID=UPI002467BFD1|nr:uncharacterized protein LOC129716549 [Wyeomyia smithii]
MENTENRVAEAGALTQNTQDPKVDDNSCENTNCHAKLDYIIRKLLQIDLMMKDITQRFDDHVFPRTKVLLPEVVFTSLPIKSVEDLEDFEQKLENVAYLQAFQTKIARLGGKNSSKKIINAMESIFSNEFAAYYSWQGRKHKEKISEQKIIKTLEDYLLKMVPDLNRATFNEVGACWFRFAKQRLLRAAK